MYAPRQTNDSVHIVRVPLDGSPEVRLFSIDVSGGGAPQMVRDGRSLVYPASARDGTNAILRVWIDGSGRVDTLVHERRDRLSAFMTRLSPEGHAVALQDRLTGDVYVQLLSGGGALQVSEVPAGYRRPVVWGPDGRRLYYMGANGLNIIDLETSPSLRVVRRQVRSGFPLGPIYDLSPDGRTFITLDPVAAGGDVWVVVNWMEEARRGWTKP